MLDTPDTYSIYIYNELVAVCGSRVCGSRVCGSRVCRSRVCGSRVCGSRVCGSRMCRSRVCRSRVCRSRCAAAECAAAGCAVQLKSIHSHSHTPFKLCVLYHLIQLQQFLQVTKGCLIQLMFPDETKDVRMAKSTGEEEE